MTDERASFGAYGETMASEELARQGYRIVERNCRSRWGELDVVAYHGETLVFVEVKARRGTKFGDPAAAVDRRKQQRLVRLAQRYLAHRRLGEPLCRFDIVVVDQRAEGQFRIEVIPNAFDASCVE